MLEIKKKKGLVAAGRKAAGQQLTRAFRTHSREFSFSFGLPIPPLFCIEKRKKKKDFPPFLIYFFSGSSFFYDPLSSLHVGRCDCLHLSSIDPSIFSQAVSLLSQCFFSSSPALWLQRLYFGQNLVSPR